MVSMQKKRGGERERGEWETRERDREGTRAQQINVEAA